MLHKEWVGERQKWKQGDPFEGVASNPWENGHPRKAMALEIEIDGLRKVGSRRIG